MSRGSDELGDGAPIFGVPHEEASVSSRHNKRIMDAAAVNEAHLSGNDRSRDQAEAPGDPAEDHHCEHRQDEDLNFVPR